MVIRRIASSDYEGIVALLSFPKVIRCTLQMPYPSADEWKAKLAANSTSDFLGLVAVLDGLLVGSASLHWSPRPRVRHVADLGMSVRDTHHGQGIGSALMAALLDMADNWLNVLRVELSVCTDNDAAIRLYTRYGFKVEGRRVAACFREGEYVDLFFMSRLRPGFAPPPTPSALKEVLVR